jgi:rfaE bifunctional protein kinase chain/domain
MSLGLDRVFKSLKQPKISPSETLLKIVGGFEGKRLLVIGDLGVDKYTIGDVSRISPEAPVPVLNVVDRKQKLGLAANVAENIKTLGGDPTLVGVIGEDSGAEEIKALLRKADLKGEGLLVDPQRPTAVKERVVARNQQLVRIDYETIFPFSSDFYKQFLKRVQSLINKAKAENRAFHGVIVEDYGKGFISEAAFEPLSNLCKKEGLSLAVDPNRNQRLSVYQGADFITPNFEEAEQLTGIRVTGVESFLDMGQTLRRVTQCEFAAITAGPYGMTFFDQDGGCYRVPTVASEVFDVSGAGDTAVAALSLGLLSGASVSDAISIANVASGMVVGKRGTATVSLKELNQRLERPVSPRF